jgi:hypothetical protein
LERDSGAAHRHQRLGARIVVPDRRHLRPASRARGRSAPATISRRPGEPGGPARGAAHRANGSEGARAPDRPRVPPRKPERHGASRDDRPRSRVEPRLAVRRAAGDRSRHRRAASRSSPSIR